MVQSYAQIDEGVRMNAYVITYTDNRVGDLRITEVQAEDESGALDEAMEDYYFGKLIELVRDGKS